MRREIAMNNARESLNHLGSNCKLPMEDKILIATSLINNSLNIHNRKNIGISEWVRILELLLLESCNNS